MAEESLLQRLLDKELAAQERVEAAFRKRDELLEQARKDVRAAEERFEARLPELYASYRKAAESDAERAVAEVNRRYQESADRLRALAESGRGEALEDALEVLLDGRQL